MSGYWFFPLERIVSGGQTGADRAGLDVALMNHFPYGGWCPKGRLAEDGAIPDAYDLKETPSASYLQWTEWNVRDSDGTVIFTMAPTLSGGSKRTADFADKHGRPFLHIDSSNSDGTTEFLEFVDTHEIRVLNVAGSRSSKEPALYPWVTGFLNYTLFYGEPYSLIGFARRFLSPEMDLLGALDHAEASAIENSNVESRYYQCWRFYYKRKDNIVLRPSGYTDYFLVQKQSGSIFPKSSE